MKIKDRIERERERARVKRSHSAGERDKNGEDRNMERGKGLEAFSSRQTGRNGNRQQGLRDLERESHVKKMGRTLANKRDRDRQHPTTGAHIHNRHRTGRPTKNGNM